MTHRRSATVMDVAQGAIDGLRGDRIDAVEYAVSQMSGYLALGAATVICVFFLF